MSDQVDESPIYVIRRENLRELIARYPGGALALSKVLGYANSSYLSQVAGKSPTRQITEKFAREIERAIGIEPGVLDSDPHQIKAQWMEYKKEKDPLVKLAETTTRYVTKKITEPIIEVEADLPREIKHSGSVKLSANSKISTRGVFSPIKLNQMEPLIPNADDTGIKSKNGKKFDLADVLEAVSRAYEEASAIPGPSQFSETVKVMWEDTVENRCEKIDLKLLNRLIRVACP